jgi:hypothetical protein
VVASRNEAKALAAMKTISVLLLFALRAFLLTLFGR